MRRLACLFGLILAVPAAGQRIPAEITAGLENATLHFPLPEGYCALDRSQPADAKLFDSQAAALQPLSRLLGLAVECGELESFRSAQTQFGRYVEFMAPLADGQPTSRPDAERADYLAELAGKLPKLDAQTVSDVPSKPAKPQGVTTSVQQMGLLGQDAVAVYLGGTVSYNDAAVANVSAITLAGGWVLSSSFFNGKPVAGTVPQLIDLAKAEARALIVANSGGAAPPAGSTVETSWMIALGAAVVLLAVSVLRLIRRRR